LATQWWPNGQMKFKGVYKNGEGVHSTFKNWDANGKPYK
jgi:antitoxin component YwqK of YwqJK toxin-antitoxin module